MTMCHGHDENPTELDAIDHAEGIPSQQEASRAVIVGWPRMWSFGFFQGRVEVLKGEGHAPPPREFADVPRTTGGSSLGRHRRVPSGHESQPTTLLPRLDRLPIQGSE